MLKPLTVWIKTNWKILKEMGIPDYLTCLLRNLYAGLEATVLELDMEQHTGYKLGKEYDKAVYCHPAYLTYTQSITYLFVVTQLCLTLCDPVICSHQVSLSMEFSAKNTGVGCHSLLQGIFPTQE